VHEGTKCLFWKPAGNGKIQLTDGTEGWIEDDAIKE
jgi:hypothetical protein